MLITNIKGLAGTWTDAVVAGSAMANVPIVEDAFLLIKEGLIADFGSMDNCPDVARSDVDATGCYVIPAFCDSHTHLVYAGSREGEWTDRLRGASYEQIARRGGGILNSVDRLRAASEDELFEGAAERCREIMSYGTGAVEIKSGYGLDLESELKMLRVVRRLSETLPMVVRSTFLAAHAVPREYAGRQQQYVDLICREMLPAVAAEGLADFVDVFCDEGFFTVRQTEQILEAGLRGGLRGKIHANEMAASGGVEIGCAMGCLSVDHLERMDESAVAALCEFRATMPTALPGASAFLGIPYAPVRDMIDRGLAVALASDFNPGSAPSGNMQLVGSLACMGAGMLPLEALTASTVNSAAAMGLSSGVMSCGRIVRGGVANVCVTRPLPSLASLYYNFGSNSIARTVLGGV